MKGLRVKKQNPLFLAGILIMLGSLLLLISVTLFCIAKVNEINYKNQMQLNMSIQLQNLMEYCKVNKLELEASLNHLGGIPSQEVDEDKVDYKRWTIFYNENWKQIESKKNAHYSIEVHIHTIPYTYGKLKEIVLEGYRIKNYNLKEDGSKGSGKLRILSLESSCIIGENL